MKAPVVWAAVLVAALGVAAPAGAETYVVDRVVAVVESEAILLSSLRRRARPYLRQALASTTTDAERLVVRSRIYQQMLDKMIEEQLIVRAARKEQVEVRADEVQRALEQVAKTSGLTVKDLLRTVRSDAGMTAEQYRQELARQILEGKMLTKRLEGDLRPTDEAALRARYEQFQKASDEPLPPFEQMRPQLETAERVERMAAEKRRWLEVLRRETYVDKRLAL